MTIGFRILRRVRKVDAGAVAKFKALPLANVSDVMSRMSAGGARLRPMHGKGALAGPALTVKTRPGDNLMVHKALDLAEPGDVIVVDAGGDLTSAIIGELMVAHARKRGVAGCVIDGALCVPFAEVEAVFRAAKAKQESEVQQAAAIKAGTSDRAWVDETLKRLGCEFAGAGR